MTVNRGWLAHPPRTEMNREVRRQIMFVYTSAHFPLA